MADAKEVGRRLRKAREKKGLTQEEAAPRLGMHAITLTNIETGKRRRTPGSDVLAKAAELYGVPVAELLGSNGEASDVVGTTLDEWRAATARRLRELAKEIEQGKIPSVPVPVHHRETIATAGKKDEKKPTG